MLDEIEHICIVFIKTNATFEGDFNTEYIYSYFICEMIQRMLNIFLKEHEA